MNNLSQTTKIASFSVTNSNLVIKSTVKYVYSLFSISFVFTFPAGISVLFLFYNTYYIYLCTFPHSLSLLATNNFSLPTLSSSIFLYVLLSRYNWIISTSNLLYFSTYTFLSFNIKSFSICYSSPHNTFISISTSSLFITTSTKL